MTLYDILFSLREIFIPLGHLSFADFLGMMAGLLSTFAFLPQAVMVWHTKSTHDLSLGMYVLYTAALLLWGVYGGMIDSWPLVITETLSLVLSVYILVMKLLEK